MGDIDISLTKRQKIIGNVVFIAVFIMLALFFILAGFSILDVNLQQSVVLILLAIAVVLISIGFIQTFNTVLLWCGFCSLWISIVIYLEMIAQLSYNIKNFFYCLAPVVASILALPLSEVKLIHLKACLFFFGIAFIVLLASQNIVLCILLVTFFVIVYFIIIGFLKNRRNLK